MENHTWTRACLLRLRFCWYLATQNAVSADTDTEGTGSVVQTPPADGAGLSRTDSKDQIPVKERGNIPLSDVSTNKCLRYDWF